MQTSNLKMKTLNFLKLCVFLFVFIILNFKVLSLPFPSIFAQSRLTYPIPELGFCRDAKECYLYCQIPENKAACWSYGKYKLGPQVLGANTMSEEEKRFMREKAKQYGITFPIAELDNCAGPAECRDFCEQPNNHQTCMDFAKKKGFAREMDQRPGGIAQEKRLQIMQSAQRELGCTSMESCRNVCEQDQARCEAFAKKYGLTQEPPAEYRQKKEEMMKKARVDLGCDSMESCRSVCEKNPERCMQFARRHGFDRGSHPQSPPPEASPNYGIQRFGKGGCDSQDSCKKYCQEHPDECPGFQGYTRAIEGGVSSQQSPGTYVGPTGCRSETECKGFCETNPDKCPGFRQSQQKMPTYQEQYPYQPPSVSPYPSYAPGGGTYLEPIPISYPTYSTTPNTQP